MNTNIVIAVLVVVFVAAGAWVLFSGEEVAAPSTAETDTTTREDSADSERSVETAEPFAGEGSLLSLMGLGKDLVCDFSYVAEDTAGAVAGTVKISKDRVRGDFEMMQSGEVYESHMIQDEEYLYTWSETPQGTFALKMNLEETDTNSADSNSNYDQRSIDMDNPVDYDCRAWNVNDSEFQPPSDIEFVSPESMMQNMMRNFDPSAYSQ